MTIDKWIVLVVAICAIVALNVNFIRRMNRRQREQRVDVSASDETNAKHE